MRYLTNVKRGVNEHTALLDLHVYHALNVRLTCVKKTHVAHFPVCGRTKTTINCNKFVLLQGGYFVI